MIKNLAVILNCTSTETWQILPRLTKDTKKNHSRKFSKRLEESGMKQKTMQFTATEVKKVSQKKPHTDLEGRFCQQTLPWKKGVSNRDNPGLLPVTMHSSRSSKMQKKLKMGFLKKPSVCYLQNKQKVSIYNGKTTDLLYWTYK